MEIHSLTKCRSGGQLSIGSTFICVKNAVEFEINALMLCDMWCEKTPFLILEYALYYRTSLYTFQRWLHKKDNILFEHSSLIRF